MDLIIFIGWFIAGSFMPVIFHRFYPKLLHSIRFIAFYITTYLGGISVILGLSIKDTTIFLVSIIISLWGGLQILLLPRISPKLVKRFDLKD
jgi:hypothetical protein